MPEGHTIHRAARDHHRIFAGQKLIVSSPQGRFSQGASLLNEQTCSAVEAFGKHLLYKFNNEYTLHIHLGLFGRIRKQKLPLAEPKGSVRVRLIGKTHLIDINGPTICEILDQKEVMALVGRIGPDVLRTDANPDLAYNKIARSRAPIGRLIMDQSVMAGIGNIYRSEILWRQAIHPETPGKAINRQTFDQIWDDARTLLAIGVERNAIITVFDGQLPKKRYGEKFNIFGKASCPKCEGEIRRFEISGRRTFVCDTCQPLMR
ncbi:MAG: Fpg/Nei family DNA glycosylase [Candidatus Puniceispirillum sp.]|nr:Fpg/Nei family DNA glycosylase [Candidatus Puniceispirillum sp.]